MIWDFAVHFAVISPVLSVSVTFASSTNGPQITFANNRDAVPKSKTPISTTMNTEFLICLVDAVISE